MFLSIDGKIQNQFGNHPDVRHAAEIYEQLNYSYGQAIGIGRNTVDTGKRPDLTPHQGVTAEYRDKIIRDECTYGVVFDRRGKLCWDSKYQQFPDLPKQRIIEVLTHRASPAYLAYLDDLEIPYLFGGEEELDLAFVLHKLRRDYNVETMVLGGGATLNAAFFAAGLVDEISLVIAPGIGPGGDRLGLIGPGNPFPDPQFYKLKQAEPLGHNGLLLHYEK